MVLEISGDIRKRNYTNTQKKIVWVLPLQSYFGTIREETVIWAEVLFAYSLGEHHLVFQLGDHCTKLFKLMFPDSSIAKDFKCSRAKATTVFKVIGQVCWKKISVAVRETKYGGDSTSNLRNLNTYL